MLTTVRCYDFNHLTNHIRTISLFSTLQVAITHQSDLISIDGNNTMQDIAVVKIGQHNVTHSQAVRLTQFDVIDLTSNA